MVCRASSKPVVVQAAVHTHLRVPPPPGSCVLCNWSASGVILEEAFLVGAVAWRLRLGGGAREPARRDVALDRWLLGFCPGVVLDLISCSRLGWFLPWAAGAGIQVWLAVIGSPALEWRLCPGVALLWAPALAWQKSTPASALGRGHMGLQVLWGRGPRTRFAWRFEMSRALFGLVYSSAVVLWRCSRIL
jgi:hypothetical protein